jgi:hypothetical protein
VTAAVDWALAIGAEKRAILSSQAMEITCRDHTYRNRMQTMLEQIDAG